MTAVLRFQSYGLGVVVVVVVIAARPVRSQMTHGGSEALHLASASASVIAGSSPRGGTGRRRALHLFLPLRQGFQSATKMENSPRQESTEERVVALGGERRRGVFYHRARIAAHRVESRAYDTYIFIAPEQLNRYGVRTAARGWRERRR